MAVAKKAISKIAKAIPRINKVLSSLAIAVIAMTLSRDIDTSAIIIVIKAAFRPLPETSFLSFSSFSLFEENSFIS